MVAEQHTAEHTRPGQEGARWWGPLTLEEGEARQLRLGPLTLWALRLRREWRLTYQRGDDPLDATWEPPRRVSPDEFPEAADRWRFGFDHSPSSVTLAPRLADRPVVVRPEHAFYVHPGESVRMYLTTPVWLHITLGTKSAATHEIPVYRPSDTWFGPTTMEGELCYASRSLLRLEERELEFRPHRAVTEVILKNRAEDALLVERLKIPVQHLSVFASQSFALWTEALTLVREEDGDFAKMRIGASPPPHVEGAERIAPARQHGTNLMFRAFQALFHP